MLHNSQFFHWTRLEITQAYVLKNAEHSKGYLWTRFGYSHSQACSENTYEIAWACSEKVLKHVQEPAAYYEAFCQMRIKI